MSGKKQQAAPAGASDFDSEVDAARKRLEAALTEEEAFDDLAALQALAPVLERRISSRRLAFTLGDEDDEETQIAVIHVNTDESCHPLQSSSRTSC